MWFITTTGKPPYLHNSPPPMQIEMWPIHRPIPYRKNARKITEQAIDKVAASIKEYGWQQVIVVDDNDEIIIGHTRLMAAAKLGLSEVPVKVATGLTKAQVKALRIADNRTGQETKWDFDLLGVELKDLKTEFDFDLLQTGFDEFELQSFLAIDQLPPELPTDSENEPRGKDDFRTLKLTKEQHEIVGRAIMAIRIGESDTTMSDGRALELLAADFLAGTPFANLPESTTPDAR